MQYPRSRPYSRLAALAGALLLMLLPARAHPAGDDLPPPAGSPASAVGAPGSAPSPSPAASQGLIQGSVFRDRNGNGRRDAGEAPVVGAAVELWNTTSIIGRPTRLQTTQTDAQGRYQFAVNPLQGPIPDFGCYEVRASVPAGQGGGAFRSAPLCQIAAGAMVTLDIPLPGENRVNRPPAIVAVRIDPSGAAPGGSVRLEALGIDPDEDYLTYRWMAAGGSLGDPEGPLVDWTAPADPGRYPIWVVATDSEGLSAWARVVIPVSAAPVRFNQPPMVESMTAETLTPAPGQSVRLTLTASDPDGDLVRSRFYFAGARSYRGGPATIWRAPSDPGIYSTYGVAGDGHGGYGWATRELSVNSAQMLNRDAPSFGSAGNLLIDSYGYLLWVGIDDPRAAQQATALTSQGALQWVLGQVVPDAGQRHGFYLDPATVSLAEVTAEGIQTTVEQVSRRPAFYAPGGAGHLNAWALSGRLIQFVPAP